MSGVDRIDGKLAYHGKVLPAGPWHARRVHMCPRSLEFSTIDEDEFSASNEEGD